MPEADCGSGEAIAMSMLVSAAGLESACALKPSSSAVSANNNFISNIILLIITFTVIALVIQTYSHLNIYAPSARNIALIAVITHTCGITCDSVAPSAMIARVAVIR